MAVTRPQRNRRFSVRSNQRRNPARKACHADGGSRYGRNADVRKSGFRRCRCGCGNSQSDSVGHGRRRWHHRQGGTTQRGRHAESAVLGDGGRRRRRHSTFERSGIGVADGFNVRADLHRDALACGNHRHRNARFRRRTWNQSRFGGGHRPVGDRCDRQRRGFHHGRRLDGDSQRLRAHGRADQAVCFSRECRRGIHDQRNIGLAANRHVQVPLGMERIA